MAGCNGGGYGTVQVKDKETVAAVLPLQEHWLPLSNLDLLLPPLDFGVFFCYHLPNSTFDALTSSLKASLARTLVTYYPFAGEVVANSAGEPELLCNNRGVDFVTAYADVELQDLQLYNPDDSVENKLIPKKKDGVLCFQATELKSGGVVLACTFDHRISDAYSANMFLVAWAEMSAHDGIASAPPTFRRSLLSPRRSGCHDTSAQDALYVPLSSLRPPADDGRRKRSVLNRIYYVTASDIDKMQAEAQTGSDGRRSKVEAFSAYLWRAAARSVSKKQAACRMGVVVNGRYRLKPTESMASYFGNVLSIPYGTAGAEDLMRMDLREVAAKVHDFMQTATTEEHFLGLVDWVEARRPEPAVARIYCNGGADEEEEEDEGMAFVVSSGRGFPVGELDFGWGRPVFGSYHFPWGDSAGYVMPMPSARANGDWVVYAHLAEDHIQQLESDGMLRPLTPNYLFLTRQEQLQLPAGSYSAA